MAVDTASFYDICVEIPFNAQLCLLGVPVRAPQQKGGLRLLFILVLLCEFFVCIETQAVERII